MKNNMKKYLDTYSKVKSILINEVRARNSDKVLIWAFWSDELDAMDGIRTEKHLYRKSIALPEFLKLTTPESITRARRKVVEEYPGLKGNELVEAGRAEKRASQGAFIYQEGK